MKIRDSIKIVLADNQFHSFDSILASIVKTKTGDPHLTTQSIRLCLNIKDKVYIELCEMVRYKLVEYNYDNQCYRKKQNETHSSSSDQQE